MLNEMFELTPVLLAIAATTSINAAAAKPL
jgi:hypothetical protein